MGIEWCRLRLCIPKDGPAFLSTFCHYISDTVLSSVLSTHLSVLSTYRVDQIVVIGLTVRSGETDYAYSYRGEISGQVAAGTLSARLPRRPGSSSLCSFRRGRQEAAEKASLVLHSGERAV